MSLSKVPQVEFELDVVEQEFNEQDNLCNRSNQRISKNGRILVSKKAWIIRTLLIAGLILFMIYNINVALSIGDPLIVYSTLMPIHTILILIIGWVFFKNNASGCSPRSLVSVIIPVYNQENLIGKVIDAIYRSTYSNLEVVAVNDGSKDNTSQVLERLAKKYHTLKIINKANGGKRTAVATGFYAAKGDFVVLIDSDSIVDKYAIEEFMKTFNANPKVGGVVGNGKVLNSDKNILTKCQDVWYDYSFNIHKTTESTFGTVLCLSGCLAAYRREAIAHFVAIWAKDKAQYGDDRNLTTYAIATTWAKEQLAPIEKRLLISMASYDDAEDRGLTSHAIKEWQTVYVPTAIVYTDVPENIRQYFRQQIRWKKGYLRSTFFISAFFWRKNPIMVMLFYLEFMSAFISPAIVFSVFIYGPILLHTYWYPLIYIAGQLLIGVITGLDYKFRDPPTKNWLYKPLMNLISALVLPWVLFPALKDFKKNGWLTR